MPTYSQHLDRLAALADANAEDVARVSAGLDATRLVWRPSPARWGVADCLEHLIVTGAMYHSRIRTLIAEAPHPAAADVLGATRWSPSVLGRFFLWSTGPDGFRLPAPAPMVPPPARADAPARLLAQQDELRAIIADARGVDLRAVRVTSPLSKAVRLRLGEALEMLLGHQRRHLNQAWRVRRAPNFPAVRPAA